MFFTLTSFIHQLHAMGLWQQGAGTNLLDTGAPFYDTYACRDGLFVAVGALEPQFYSELLRLLELEEEETAVGESKSFICIVIIITSIVLMEIMITR